MEDATAREVGLRVWWQRLHHDSDEQLDKAYLMRMAGGFARRVRAWTVGTLARRREPRQPGSACRNGGLASLWVVTLEQRRVGASSERHTERESCRVSGRYILEHAHPCG